ncbi:hypothetical protein [uncultured Dokdonia sp.]|uniref:hypothetical protein n=1 Tax=uncultured Dokdonia sp. TaxID=575653 RepID=UPI002623047E|nr:hypothetical protein [uncultured Dokdonia sp.]
MTFRNFLLSITILFCLVSCGNEDLDDLFQITEAELIAEDSELFDLMNRITTDDPSATDVTCINFIYSFTVVIYNEDIELQSSIIVNNDEEFSNVLGSVEDGQFINVSFPITSTLDDGTSLTINDKDELRAAIDACIEEEQEIIIGNASASAVECVWEVQIPDDIAFNTYVDAVFKLSSAGVVEFFYRGDVYDGTWIFYFIEDELHLNINLDDSETDGVVGEDWNFDWKVLALTNVMIDIENDAATRFILEKECEAGAYCTTLLFEECEEEDTPGVATFTLEDYIECIIVIAAPQPEINDMGEVSDPVEWQITFYDTEIEAETAINPIPADVAIITDVRDIYVRIENPDTLEFTTTLLTLQSMECED